MLACDCEAGVGERGVGVVEKIGREEVEDSLAFVWGKIREQGSGVEEGGNGSYGDRLGRRGRVGAGVVLRSTAEGDSL